MPNLQYGFIVVTKPDGTSPGRALVNNGLAHVKKPILNVAIISGNQILDAVTKQIVLGTFGGGKVLSFKQNAPIATYGNGELKLGNNVVAHYTPPEDERGGAVAAVLTGLLPL